MPSPSTKPPSTTARLAGATIALLALCLATIWLLAFLPDIPAEAWSTLGTLSLAVAGGSSLSTAAYGVRHYRASSARSTTDDP